MASKKEKQTEFRSPSVKEIESAAAKKASEFKKLSSGEQYILEQGFKFGAEFTIEYNNQSPVNS
jgi:ribulose bisphosphate carboxylase small subunit